jgi:dihydrofolate reductase
MQGGTIFHFVSADIEEALRLAKDAAGEKDVKIGGGVSTVRQYLQAGLIDTLHLALAPVVFSRDSKSSLNLHLTSLLPVQPGFKLVLLVHL